MSYGFAVKVTPSTDIEVAINASFDLPAFGIEGNQTPRVGQAAHGTADEAERAIQAVASVADEVIRGAFGDGWAEINIAVNGHANPKNEKKEGWANDCITLTLNVSSYEETP